MKFNIYILRLFIIIFTFCYATTQTIHAQISGIGAKSYVLEQTPREAMTTLSNSTAYTSVQSTVRYVDGLGRPLQTVIVRGSGDGTKDVLSTTAVYDDFGRNFKNFLPIPNSSVGGAYLANPQTLGSAFYADTHPYTEVSTFDNSPLNRPTESFGAGQNWRTVGNTKPVNRQYNIPAPNTVIYFQAGLIGVSGGSTTLQYYGANDLTMTTSISERGKKIIEYRDLQDRVIRKDVEVSADTTITTHYVYDIFERLAYVIPPEAYKLFSNSRLSISETDTEFKELIYSYRYDERGRNIRKHIPGAGWTEICYDKLDRPVMSQDQQEASKNPKQWQFLQYDAFGRTVLSGITDSYNSSDRDALQTAFNGITTPYERRTTTGLLYSNTSYPSSVVTTDAQVMKVNYFDDYGTDWIPTGLDFLTATGGDAPFSQTQMNGMLLGYKERNLETNVLYTSTMYYDDRKRMVNSNSENHVGGKDRININYSFTGEILKARKIHDKGTTISTILEVSEYTYDHLGRKISYVFNGKPIARYEYDGIGRLKNKRFSPSGTTQNSKQTGNWTDANTWLSGLLPNANDNVIINTGHTLTIPNGQIAGAGTLNDKGTVRNFGTLNMGKFSTTDLYNQSMSYHIRGSLRGINLDANNNLTNALFSLKLSYEDDQTYFDGNIRKQEWKTSLDNVTRSFTYRYDGSSRVKAGVFAGTGGENYTLADVTYDNNGNIKKLIRNGLISANTFGIVDNLSYTYNANSNKILKVDDLSNVTASFADVAGNDYTYSPDGSLISDANKGIGTIEYNYLKLPKRIVKGAVTILYEYSSSGKKLRETIGANTTDYVGNIIYKNGALYQVSHEEGRVVDGQNEYDIKDHLGNLRVAFRDNNGVAEITQSNAYGIWGEDLTSLSFLKPTWKEDKFKFTGKEDLPETGYIDFGARLYDKLVPHFITIDPLTETSRRFSPFTYGNNNPIMFTDPDGMESRGVDGSVTFNGYVGDDGNGYFSGTTKGDDKPKVNTSTNSKKDPKYKGGTRLLGTTSDNSTGNKLASGTLAFISADALLPDPTDAALPKWAAYAVGGALAGAYLYSSDWVEKLKDALDPKGFKYVTYTKTNKEGLVYVGRSSGYESPEQIVRNRDSGHHIKGYGPAVLSTFAPAMIDGGYGKRLLDPAYWSIRGSEQLQIEMYRRLGISGNDRNGIGPNNEDIEKFLEYGRNLFK